MLQHFSVSQLNGRTNCDLHFQPDLNIITGRNGSGKTTVLKLLWYLMSGNLERIFPEMSFDRLHLQTDAFSIAIRRTSNIKRKQVHIEVTPAGGNPHTRQVRINEGDLAIVLDPVNRLIVSFNTQSVYLPTFRRIEGGYTFHNAFRRYGEHHLGPGPLTLDNAMKLMSDDMSTPGNRFVASLSTQDIVTLLTSRFAEVSEQVNRYHIDLATYITERIRLQKLSGDERHGGTHEGPPADPVLRDIEDQVNVVKARHHALLRPFSVLTDLVSTILNYNGMQVSEGVTLGESERAISSDKLSAGEKQMLSFLVYNAFYNNCSIFIDEPELSLHADWQRLLFPTLLRQESGNQFIVATHSPFIYGNYPDKELTLNADRGGE
jgi:predicted ATPase